MPLSGFAMRPNADLSWPALPLREWRETCDTLHMWTQIVGKVRMALSPELNHWWHVALYVNARGLWTSPIPFGAGLFEIQFDFLKHQLEICTSEGGRKILPLSPQPVAMFYGRLMEALSALGVTVEINPEPQEVQGFARFDQDFEHASYDREYAYRFWRVLVSTARVLEEFRSAFIGKCSPVHFFWGSFDLTHTRFSGRSAPPRKGAITGPAYSHEEISLGFWPGGGVVDDAAFYGYAAPAPQGLEHAAVRPAGAAWNRDLGEFILMYDDARRAASPHAAVRDFFDSVYEAGARLAGWDRALERAPATSAAH